MRFNEAHPEFAAIEGYITREKLEHSVAVADKIAALLMQATTALRKIGG